MISEKGKPLKLACSGNRDIGVSPGWVFVSKKKILFFFVSKIKSVLASELQPKSLCALVANLRHFV